MGVNYSRNGNSLKNSNIKKIKKTLPYQWVCRGTIIRNKNSQLKNVFSMKNRFHMKLS